MWGYKSKKQKFNQWIDDYHTSLFRHAYLMTNDRELAQDIVQETYHQAWLAIKSLQDETKAHSWLLTILKRCVYKEYKFKSQHASLVKNMTKITKASTTNDAQDLVLVTQLLNKISPEQKEILLLKHLHGFSYEEISQYLTIPLGTVMSRLSRAKHALKKVSSASLEQKIITPFLVKDFN